MQTIDGGMVPPLAVLLLYKMARPRLPGAAALHARVRALHLGAGGHGCRRIKLGPQPWVRRVRRRGRPQLEPPSAPRPPAAATTSRAKRMCMMRAPEQKRLLLALAAAPASCGPPPRLMRLKRGWPPVQNAPAQQTARTSNDSLTAAGAASQTPLVCVCVYSQKCSGFLLLCWTRRPALESHCQRAAAAAAEASTQTKGRQPQARRHAHRTPPPPLAQPCGGRGPPQHLAGAPAPQQARARSGARSASRPGPRRRGSSAPPHQALAQRRQHPLVVPQRPGPGGGPAPGRCLATCHPRAWLQRCGLRCSRPPHSPRPVRGARHTAAPAAPPSGSGPASPVIRQAGNTSASAAWVLQACAQAWGIALALAIPRSSLGLGLGPLAGLLPHALADKLAPHLNSQNISGTPAALAHPRPRPFRPP
jgi:hypothetical protein